jgi:hypothetical protein
MGVSSMKKVHVIVGVLILVLLLAPCVSAEGITVLSGHLVPFRSDPTPENFVPVAGRLTYTPHIGDNPYFVDNGALLITNNFDHTVCTQTWGKDAWGECLDEPNGYEVLLPGESAVEIFAQPDDYYWSEWGPGVYDFGGMRSLIGVDVGDWVKMEEGNDWWCAFGDEEEGGRIYVPTRIVILSPQHEIPSPEFPSALLPATMIIGFLGAVLLIQRTKEH